MSEQTKSSVFDRVAFYVFGVVSAAAAIIAIYNFSTEPSSSLRAEAYINRFIVAERTLDALDRSRIGSVVGQYSSVRDQLGCDEDAQPEDWKFQSECTSISQIEEAFEKVVLPSGSGGAVLEIKFQNEGAVSAEGIRISGRLLEALEVMDANGKFRTVQQEADAAYSIPDINPGDSAEVRAYLPYEFYHYSQYSAEDSVPTITYSNGQVHVDVYSHANTNSFQRGSPFGSVSLWVLLPMAVVLAVLWGAYIIEQRRRNEVSSSGQEADEIEE